MTMPRSVSATLAGVAVTAVLSACGGMSDAVGTTNRMFSDMELISCDFRENRSDKDREECRKLREKAGDGN